MRFERKRGDEDYLKGFTVAMQMPDAIKEPVTTLEALKKLAADPDLWKMDLQTGEVKQRQEREGGTRKGDLWATPKAAQIPADWLDVDGVTDETEPGEEAPVGGTKNFPGVFLIVQKGTVEWGAQKAQMAEFFLHGDTWKGRWVFRQLGAGEKAEDVLPPGKASEDGADSTRWLLIQAESQPYVLSPGAVSKAWLPPKGVSCLPAKTRRKVPANLRYWLMEGQAALDARKELAGIEELGGPELHGGAKMVDDNALLADLLDMGWLEGEVM